MISYFKYVDSGAFTANASPYSGMVTVVGDNVYSGSKLTSNSVLLSATNTFLPQVIQNRIDFGPTYNEKIQLSKANILQRDILNLNTIRNIMDKLNTNNLRIFANQIAYNPNIFNSLTKTQDQLTFTYCVTSVNDTFNGKKLPLFRSSADSTDFAKIKGNSVDENTLFLTGLSGTYYYYSSGYVIKGNTTSSTTTVAEGLNATTFDHKFIKFNPYTNTLYQTTTDNCTIYNFNYGNGGNVLSLNDRFDITATRTLTDRRNSTYGASYRTALVEEQGALVLEISYVDSQNSIITYSSQELGFNTVTRVVQRFEDDILIVIGTIGDNIFAKVYDIPELIKSPTPLYSNELIGCNLTDVYELATFDSNILIVRRYKEDNTLNYVEFRSVTNSKYPTVRFSVDSQLGILKVNQIISEQYTAIDTTNIVLLPTDAVSNNNNVYDIQFSVSDTLNAIIVFSDSYTVINNSVFLQLVYPYIEKRYVDIDIYDNSIGLNLNNTFKNIIFDTVKLYLSCSKKYKFRNDGTIRGYDPILSINNILTDDLYLYENEYINVGVINRVINALYALQEKLAVNTNS